MHEDEGSSFGPWSFRCWAVPLPFADSFGLGSLAPMVIYGWFRQALKPDEKMAEMTIMGF